MTDEVELGTSQALDVVRKLNQQFKLFEQLEEVLQAALRSDKELNRVKQSHETAVKQLADVKKQLTEAQDALSKFKEQAKAETAQVSQERAEAVRKHNREAKQRMQHNSDALDASQRSLKEARSEHAAFMAESTKDRAVVADKLSSLRADLDKLKNSLVGA